MGKLIFTKVNAFFKRNEKGYYNFYLCLGDMLYLHNKYNKPTKDETLIDYYKNQIKLLTPIEVIKSDFIAVNHYIVRMDTSHVFNTLLELSHKEFIESIINDLCNKFDKNNNSIKLEIGYYICTFHKVLLDMLNVQFQATELIVFVFYYLVKNYIKGQFKIDYGFMDENIIDYKPTAKDITQSKIFLTTELINKMKIENADLTTKFLSLSFIAERA